MVVKCSLEYCLIFRYWQAVLGYFGAQNVCEVWYNVNWKRCNAVVLCRLVLSQVLQLAALWFLAFWGSGSLCCKPFRWGHVCFPKMWPIAAIPTLFIFFHLITNMWVICLCPYPHSHPMAISMIPVKNGKTGMLGQDRLEVRWEAVMFLFNVVNLNVWLFLFDYLAKCFVEVVVIMFGLNEEDNCWGGQSFYV